MNEMNNMNALNDEKMEVVVGGETMIFADLISKYSGIPGRKYYLLDHYGNWYYGTMTKTCEEEADSWFLRTKRVHYFNITIFNGVSCNQEMKFYGDDVGLYGDVIIME